MPQRQFILTTLVRAAPAMAAAFLRDLNNHRHLHPYFVSAVTVGSGVDKNGRPYEDLIVTERPRLGPIRYTITFATRMVDEGPTAFRSYVNAGLGTWLENELRCVAEGDLTRVTETVTVTAPWLTIGYVTRQAQLAHQRTFDQLPAVLTGPEEKPT